MPAVTSNSTVLVTGANGFVAVHVVKQYLEQGFKVVGTVRSPDKGDYIKDLFKNESYANNFSYVIVKDIVAKDAFDEAVKNVDVIAHTASPFHFQATDPADLIVPAVGGVVNILESAKNFGTNVKRVVITSSAVTTLGDAPAGTRFTEADWNTRDPPAVEAKGKDSNPVEIYFASKTLAERAAWKFVEENKGKIQFDISTILPPFIFGRILQQISDENAINTSNAYFRGMLFHPGAPLDKGAILSVPGAYVDVRDVAQAHVLATLQEKAGGQRFITSAGPFTFQQFIDALKETELKEKIHDGFPGEPALDLNPSFAYGGKVERELGLKYHTLKETVLDTALGLQERFPVSA